MSQDQAGESPSTDVQTFTARVGTQLVEVPVKVSTVGDLKQVVDFTRDFYQLPYLVKIRSFALEAQKDKDARKSRSSRPKPVTLQISMNVATLVLPPQMLYIETIRRIKKIAAEVARELAITGPFNM